MASDQKVSDLQPLIEMMHRQQEALESLKNGMGNRPYFTDIKILIIVVSILWMLTGYLARDAYIELKMSAQKHTSEIQDIRGNIERNTERLNSLQRQIDDLKR